MNPVRRLRSSAALAMIAMACSCARSSKQAEWTTPVGVSTVQQAVVIREPLASWASGPTKQAIVDFVTQVTAPGSPYILPVEDRIAIFDNDGTLWPERPLPEAAFVVSRLQAEAVEKSSLAEREPYRAVLQEGVEGLASLGKRAVLAELARTHAGMTDDVFEAEARTFFANAKHPQFNVPYPALAYRPMRELFAYLREHGFVLYLCASSDEEFLRAFATKTYDVPRERILGSTVKKQLGIEKETVVLKRTADLLPPNDGDEKVFTIARTIGRRPVFAAGNVRSGGDVAMLTYSRLRSGPSFALVINHDDAAREYAYAEPNGETLAAAKDHGFTVVSMKNDWKDIFDPGIKR